MIIGLCGWATRTGVGNMNFDLFEHGVADRWLVPKHPLLGIDHASLPQHPQVKICNDHWQGYREWLKGIDVLLMVESPQIRDGFDLVAEAKKLGKFVVCIPMMEWLPLEPWVAQVDMMWAVTQWTWRELQRIAPQYGRFGRVEWKDSIVGGACGWGVDPEKFPFRKRERVERFFFGNGFGGAGFRKGLHVLAIAAALVPECEIIVRSQRELPELPRNCKVFVGDAPTRYGNFDEGDMLLAPSRWEGLGLQLYEAQACGMPVITTKAPPMNECRPFGVIKVASTGTVDLCGRSCVSYEPDPEDLAYVMRVAHGMKIERQSESAREFIESQCNLRIILPELKSVIYERACGRTAAA